MTTTEKLPDPVEKQPTNGWKIFGISVICLGLVIAGFWLLKTWVFPSQFTPVSLSVNETKRLNHKLDQLNLPGLPVANTQAEGQKAKQPLEPEAYTETDASRELTFSEREINAMIAHNTDMADKLAIDLSRDLASAKLLIELDPDMPLFGGRVLRLNAGIELATANNRPVVKLRGVSAWGVPVPNAWLGNLKNVDLVNEFGDSGHFWESFAAGIERIQVTDGKLLVKLKP